MQNEYFSSAKEKNTSSELRRLLLEKEAKKKQKSRDPLETLRLALRQSSDEEMDEEQQPASRKRKTQLNDSSSEEVSGEENDDLPMNSVKRKRKDRELVVLVERPEASARSGFSEKKRRSQITYSESRAQSILVCDRDKSLPVCA